MTATSSVVSLYFLFRLKSRFDTADPRLLIQSSLKTWLLLREPFDFLPSISQCHILIGISEVALHLLSIAVAFCVLDASASSLHVFKYQPMASASNTSPLATVPLLFSTYQNPIAVFFLLSVDPIILHGRRGQPRQARSGGDPRGDHADEPASPMHEVRSTFLIYDDELL